MSSESLLVSITIPTHNRLDAIADLLTAISAQDLPEDTSLEVFLVTSPKGKDPTEIAASVRNLGLDVSILSTENVIAAKRNLGASEANGSLLIFLDDDMSVGPDFVACHLAAHTAVDMVISGQVIFPPDWVAKSNYYRYKDSAHLNHGGGSVSAAPISGHHVVTMNMSATPSTFEKSGGFDESFTKYGAEDLDFGFRCVERGLALEYSPLPLAIHSEVQADITVFLRKVYVATYYGTPHLINRFEAAGKVSTFLWTEEGLVFDMKTRVVRHILDVLSHDRLVSLFVKFLRKSDRNRLLYIRLSYQIATLCVVRMAVRDRHRHRDRSDRLPWTNTAEQDWH